MSNELKTLVILNGGLGNQLFQLGRALAASDGRPLYINDTVGFPRKHNPDLADLFSFNLTFMGTSMPLDEKMGFNRIVNRIFLHFVSSGFATTRNFLSRLIFKIFCICNRKILKGKWSLILGEGSGWNSDQKQNSNFVIFGYFQSWKWSSSPQTRNLMMKLSPNFTSNLFKFQKDQGIKKKILVVHRRIGDYVQDDTFGILPISYYQSAIKHCLRTNPIDEIWLFTDTPNAEFQIQMEPAAQIPIREISQELSPAETLELMRYGTCYVIANSSFSWWGAFLSYSDNPMVIAPAKWFKGMDDPRDICPPGWVRIDSW